METKNAVGFQSLLDLGLTQVCHTDAVSVTGNHRTQSVTSTSGKK